MAHTTVSPPLEVLRATMQPFYPTFVWVQHSCIYPLLRGSCGGVTPLYRLHWMWFGFGGVQWWRHATYLETRRVLYCPIVPTITPLRALLFPDPRFCSILGGDSALLTSHYYPTRRRIQKEIIFLIPLGIRYTSRGCTPHFILHRVVHFLHSPSWLPVAPLPFLLIAGGSGA